MAGVTGGLLDHVHDDPAQDGFGPMTTRASGEGVEVEASDGGIALPAAAVIVLEHLGQWPVDSCQELGVLDVVDAGAGPRDVEQAVFEPLSLRPGEVGDDPGDGHQR